MNAAGFFVLAGGSELARTVVYIRRIRQNQKVCNDLILQAFHRQTQAKTEKYVKNRLEIAKK
jgi:hypothetical protein